MGSFGCPHEVDGLCQRVGGAYCVPGMLGCILHGRVEFPDGQERRPRWPDGTRGRAHSRRGRSPGDDSGDREE